MASDWAHVRSLMADRCSPLLGRKPMRDEPGLEATKGHTFDSLRSDLWFVNIGYLYLRSNPSVLTDIV